MNAGRVAHCAVSAGGRKLPCGSSYCSTQCAVWDAKDHSCASATKANFFDVLDTIFPGDSTYRDIDLGISICAASEVPGLRRLALECGYDLSTEIKRAKFLMEAQRRI